MENALLIGLSRQAALRNQLNVVANNLANMNTNGYKTQRLLFEEYLMPVAQARQFEQGDQEFSYVVDYGMASNFEPGSISLTGNAFDVALEGDGYLVVDTPGGERYTRAGAMHLDASGQLVTSDGLAVQGEGGPLTFTAEDTDISIAKDGTISSSLGVKGRLRVVSFENQQGLERIGANLYTGENPVPAQNVRVLQGAIEKSNVSGVTEVSRMIEITRNYTAVSKMISDNEELRKKAIERLGSAQA
ncbi:flagellar basal-body rod protein FlgF [Stappia stellulata]|uniref:flagellar basal-body rod protein FlgF n=1 Tax=Stappia TaxID=152161 RepID=UPI001CD278F3|nr:flagellar basal-body rod protein FlgF [Stappia stellulata]MCA1244865.1 flagellar basal-body rod protein FlgF [Stappia stellulata]